MREGQWTPHPIVEREAEAVRLRIVRFRRLRNVAVASSLGAFLAYCALLPLFPTAGLPFVLLCVASLIAVRPLTVRIGRAEDARWERDAATIDEFHYGCSWLVEIVVRRGEAPTGADRGMLWIEDGRLYFVGDRTSFGLTADGIRGGCRFTSRVPGLRHELEIRLAEGSLSFSPVVPAKWQGRTTVAWMRDEIDAWTRRAEATGGQSPPFEIGMGVLSARALLLYAVAVTLAWIAVLATTLGVLPIAAFPVALSVLAFACVRNTRYSALMVWRAWRDRRRLERAQWKT